jgi:broad specificity polyphosphatase/5'/3'-nucleotidase SurE
MEEKSDLKALNEGKISLTPMNISFSTPQLFKNVEQTFKEKW